MVWRKIRQSTNGREWKVWVKEGRWKVPASEMQQNIRTFYLVCTSCLIFFLSLSLSLSLSLTHTLTRSYRIFLSHSPFFYIGLLMAAVWVCIHDTSDKFLHSLQESIKVHLFALAPYLSLSLFCLHLTPETNIAATLEGLRCTLLLLESEINV